MTNKSYALAAAQRAMRQLSSAEQDKLLEQYLSDGIAADKARIAELEEALRTMIRQADEGIRPRRGRAKALAALNKEQGQGQ